MGSTSIPQHGSRQLVSVARMADEKRSELMTAFAIATANQDCLTGNLMRVYLAPEMGLDALAWETIQNSGQLQAALDLEPGRVRISITIPGANLERSKAKNNEYDGQWICLQPGKTQKGLQPDTLYQVTKSDSDGDLWLRDADGRDIRDSRNRNYCSYSNLALATDGLPLHLALKFTLSCEIVALLLAADPATLVYQIPTDTSRCTPP